ncbi:MAG: hypothetical protein KJ971_04025 [Firmicutes bacterium]|nr:hypothetical protein [Bacillota bacterium]
MKDFFKRVFNTEFLPASEVRKIKVMLVMAFLLVITAVTIPFSIFLDYTLAVKITVIVVLFIVYGIIILLIKINKILPAIQITMLYSIGLTLFYTQGTSSFYAYLFFYISLTIIIFYQELYSYLVYGTILVVLGVFYTITHQDGLILLFDVSGSIYIYIVILVLFYIIFFIQILYTEKLYTDLNFEWVKMNKIIDKYQDDILYYLDEIRKEAKEVPLYEDTDFQKAADELSVFISEQFNENGKEITNVLDLYIYIHEKGLTKILENEEISVSMKKIANRLDKYLLNQRTEMFSMIINFYSKFRESEEYRDNRYDYSLNNLTKETDEQIIAMAMIYQYLSNEITGMDEWDQMKKVFSKEEIDALFSSSEIVDFFTPGQIGFFKDNYDLFIQYLSKKE